MNISILEDACRKAGCVPVHRDHANGLDIFVADGFSEWPHKNFKRFGLDKTDFLFGCFVTIWALTTQDGKVQLASSVFCEKNHDKEYDDPTREKMRVNAAVQAAVSHIQPAVRVKTNA